jgi:hypothetical protein
MLAHHPHGALPPSSVQLSTALSGIQSAQLQPLTRILVELAREVGADLL